MPDITKCQHSGCELEKTCWRKQAPDNPLWQAYGVPESCLEDHADYWAIEPETGDDE